MWISKAALIESHAYTIAMPTISQLHHIYTELITTIYSYSARELHIDPNLNQTRCVTGPNILNNINVNIIITEPNAFQAPLPREKCV